MDSFRNQALLRFVAVQLTPGNTDALMPVGHSHQRTRQHDERYLTRH